MGQTGIFLNPQQRLAVEDCSGRLLLLAVPGAGKTTVLVSRIAYMTGVRGISPQNILTLTFSREAAKDMAKRYEALFGGESLPKFSTIHSFSYRVLREYVRRKGSSLPELLEEGQKAQVMNGLYQELNGERMPDEVYDQVSTAIGYGKNRMLTKEEMSGLLPGLPVFYPLYLRYEEYKRQKGFFDYDDMLCYALTALRRYPALLGLFAGQYPYVNVDDAQDTSLIQHEIIRLLAGEEGRPFMVGDEDQSIYGFRGACPEALLRFQEIYPGGGILKMEENFRSTGEIVSHAARFIEGNRARYSKNMITRREQGAKIRQTFLDSADQQYDWLAQRLGELPAGETAAVLYRNNDSGLPLADLLDRKGIPFYIRDRQPALTGHFVTLDMLHFLRLYRNPSDVDAFRRVYYRMNAYISREDMEFVQRNASRGENVFNLLLLKNKEIEPEDGKGDNTARLLFLKYAVGQLGNLSPVRMLESISSDLGYLEFLRFRYSGTSLDSALQKLGALKAIARNCGDLEEFLTRLEGLEQVVARHSRREPKSAGITLSTIHSSKGLEFDRVFLIDVLEGQLPSAQAIEKQIDGDTSFMEEEARLFYVAVTRAKNQLEIVSALQAGGGSIQPSRFLHRLMDERTEGDIRLEAGMRVRHKFFGEGVILSRDDKNQSMEVRFKRYGVKMMSTSVAVSNFKKFD